MSVDTASSLFKAVLNDNLQYLISSLKHSTNTSINHNYLLIFWTVMCEACWNMVPIRITYSTKAYRHFMWPLAKRMSNTRVCLSDTVPMWMWEVWTIGLRCMWPHAGTRSTRLICSWQMGPIRTYWTTWVTLFVYQINKISKVIGPLCMIGQTDTHSTGNRIQSSSLHSSPTRIQNQKAQQQQQPRPIVWVKQSW